MNILVSCHDCLCFIVIPPTNHYIEIIRHMYVKWNVVLISKWLYILVSNSETISHSLKLSKLLFRSTFSLYQQLMYTLLGMWYMETMWRADNIAELRVHSNIKVHEIKLNCTIPSPLGTKAVVHK